MGAAATLRAWHCGGAVALCVVFFLAGLLSAGAAPYEPEIMLNCPFGRHALHVERVFLSGTVASATGPVRVTIDGAPAAVSDGTAWAHIVPVRAGANRFELRATDARGAAATRIVDVTVAAGPPAVREAADRLSLACDRAKSTPGLWPERFAALLLREVQRCGQFRSVDRANMAALLEEHWFREADLTRPADEVQPGRLLVAGLILVFSAVEREGSLEIGCALLSVSSEAVLWSAVYRAPAPSEETLDLFARGIVLDLQRLFVRRTVTIVDVSEWPLIYVDLGDDAGRWREARAFVPRDDTGGPVGTLVEVGAATAKLACRPEAPRLSPGQELLLVGSKYSSP